MLKLFGIIFVFCCVLGGYVALGGHLHVLFQPFELVIIGGAAIGAFMISNPKHVIKDCGTRFLEIFKKPKYEKEAFIELMTAMFGVFKLARTKGWLALESHIENPEDSDLFKNYEGLYNNHHALTFLCDYLRIISLGNEDPMTMEDLMNEEIEALEEEMGHAPHAITTMADAMPALGIVAAVLGVIHTMGSITEPPEVLGHLIGGALVGTFLGVLMSYGFVAPFGMAMQSRVDAEMRYYKCMKVTLLAFLGGMAPQVAVEFGRKSLPHDVQPTFLEVEEATMNAPTAPANEQQAAAA